MRGGYVFNGRKLISKLQRGLNTNLAVSIAQINLLRLNECVTAPEMAHVCTRVWKFSEESYFSVAACLCMHAFGVVQLCELLQTTALYIGPA